MITRLRVHTQDVSSRFKAFRKSLAEGMEIRGKCTCGTFVLEAHKLGARIVDVKVNVKGRAFGERRMNNQYLIQLFLS